MKLKLSALVFTVATILLLSFAVVAEPVHAPAANASLIGACVTTETQYVADGCIWRDSTTCCNEGQGHVSCVVVTTLVCCPGGCD